MHMTFAGFAVGARTDVVRTFDSEELLPLLRKTKPTVMLMLPAPLIALIRDHDATHDDFASLRLCISGGDKISEEVEKEFARKVGLEIHEIYGMTEIGTTHLNPPTGVNKQGSVGVTGAGYQASVRDDESEEVSSGQEGRLWLKGPSLMLGYWDNDEATLEVVVDDWLDSGDLMRADDDGYLWFCGRRKQIIIHDSSNISPQDVEEAVMAHPAVANAGVVGVQDPVHGENVWAFITTKQDMPVPTSDAVIRVARDRVGYKAPEVVVVLDEMAVNATGKVDRVTLKKMAADRYAAEHPV